MASKIPPVQPKGEVIARLIGEGGYHTVDAFAAAAPIALDSRLVSNAMEGKPTSVETMQKIAKKIAVKHPTVTFDDLIIKTALEGAVQADIAPAARPGELALLKMTLTIAAHPSVIQQCELEALGASLKHTVSTAAQVFVDKLVAGSLYLHLLVDDVARDDLVRAFLAGRLQRMGTFTLECTAPADYHSMITDWFLDYYSFLDSGSDYRFGLALDKEDGTSIMTLPRVFDISRPPSEDLPNDQRLWRFFSTLSSSDIENADSVWNHDGGRNIHSVAAYNPALPSRRYPAVLVDQEYLLASIRMQTRAKVDPEES